jgi:hypothetical protein
MASDPRDSRLTRWRVLLAAAWLGLLLCVASIATPAAFAGAPKGGAGAVVAIVLAREAAASLLLGGILMLLQRFWTRRQLQAGRSVQALDANLLLAAGAIFCTVAGHYALLPMMEQARGGHGSMSFAMLHGISVLFFGIKTACVAVLAWRLTRPSAFSS